MIKFAQDVFSMMLRITARDNYSGNGKDRFFPSMKVNISKSKRN
jgi:hypothetical protein